MDLTKLLKDWNIGEGISKYIHSCVNSKDEINSLVKQYQKNNYTSNIEKPKLKEFYKELKKISKNYKNCQNKKINKQCYEMDKAISCCDLSEDNYANQYKMLLDTLFKIMHQVTKPFFITNGVHIDINENVGHNWIYINMNGTKKYLCGWITLATVYIAEMTDNQYIEDAKFDFRFEDVPLTYKTTFLEVFNNDQTEQKMNFPVFKADGFKIGSFKNPNLKIISWLRLGEPCTDSQMRLLSYENKFGLQLDLMDALDIKEIWTV
jgi:hypothetical protein